LALISVSYCHVCMMNPPQRGGYNISGGGSDSCFKPFSPCGKQPQGQPVLVAIAGSSYNVLIQQNLNHYNPGNPGFIEISFAPNPNPQEKDFVVLKRIRDYWPHNQAQQTNFTIPVQFPFVDCDACVLRVRYHPNKPTEPIFHQCSDISLVSNTNSFNFPRTFAWRSNEWDTKSDLVELDATGILRPTSFSSELHNAKKNNSIYVVNGLVANVQDLLLFVAGEKGDDVDPPSMVYAYNITSDTYGLFSEINPISNGSFWCGLVSDSVSGETFLIQLVPLAGGVKWYFALFQLESDGTLGPLIGQTSPTDTFVNFLWAEVDYSRELLYILAGDENSAWAWNAMIYTFDLSMMSTSGIVIDNSAYTISSIHVEPVSGTIYAISPGLYGQNNGFSIVTVDPKSGAVNEVSNALGTNKFSNWGGSIYGRSIQSATPTIYYAHRFWSIMDGSESIGVLISQTGNTNFQYIYDFPIQLGVNSQNRLHSMIITNLYNGQKIDSKSLKKNLN